MAKLQPQKTVLVVCEGASERAYIQELNRFFREEEIPFNMVAFVCEGGDFTKVVRAYRKVRRLNPNSELLIWVDYDRYARDDRGDMDKYRHKDSDIPDFLFTTMNFEDLLSLHFEKPKLSEWIGVCTQRNHFIEPMTASEYMEPFMEFIGTSYHKGDMPFELTIDRLENLRRNLADPSVGFGCDFALIYLSNIFNKNVHKDPEA